MTASVVQAPAFRVVVADRMDLAVEGICSVLRAEPDLHVIGQATTLQSTNSLLRALRPDILLFDPDLSAPGTSLDTVASWQLQQPSLKVILLLARPERSLVRGSFALGVAGLLLKNSHASALRQAVDAVRSGHMFLDSCLTAIVADLTNDTRRHKGPLNLSPAELRVLEQLPLGLMNAEIADKLGISVHTVKSHLRNLIVKLGCRDRAHAAAIAVRLGLT